MKRSLIALACVTFGLRASSSFADNRAGARPATPPPPPPPPSAAPPGAAPAPPPQAEPSLKTPLPFETVTGGALIAGGPAVRVEIFPGAEAAKIWTYDLPDDQALELARARANQPGSWYCAETGTLCNAEGPKSVTQGEIDSLLVSARVSTPALPSSAPVFMPSVGTKADQNPTVTTIGVFNPRLLEVAPPDNRWTFLRPDGTSKRYSEPPPDRPPSADRPSSVLATFRWPVPAEFQSFDFIAVSNDCGDAIVTRFRRDFEIPIQIVESSACSASSASGPLRVKESGSVLKVTAFHLKAQSRGNQLSVTYLVETPTLLPSDTANIGFLLPDLKQGAIRIDCSGSEGASPSARSLDGEVFVLAAAPLIAGRCRLWVADLPGASVNAPIALVVRIERLDTTVGDPKGRTTVAWFASQHTPFMLPPMHDLPPEARIRIIVAANPSEPASTGVFLTDAVRRPPRDYKADRQGFERDLATGSIVVAPLCGSYELRTLDETHSCLRVYVTLPLLLATAQITRAPWVERPLTDVSLPGGIGLALAVDSYDPSLQRAFPVSFMVGGMYERISDNQSGVLTYAAIAPTIPFLGSGGTTTSIGLMMGGGLAYVIDSSPPNEGFKPAAFASIVVTTGQLVFGGGSPGIPAGFQGPSR